ncbi:hypothetical protein DAEQUDRAFT_702566 [Daedalea quercina L-15889]|uniref:Peptidase S9 prolyl oligopeptidase catalytic domain-containing protein n=1 Tax=Daedalea quercina L-15889 TaxID=1314783 RepID=A0A165U1F2_9APHY|nr:hypothetical protein DAEQUDRAFT_702566 [Daedalea quercina L-15889]
MDARDQLQKPVGVDSSDHDHRTAGWRVSTAKEWNVLGPFPIHAREQHFMSPSFPLNLSEPIDFKAKWPSSYSDGGEVEWTTARSNLDGTLNISFPDIRWASLRATEGWAGVQHHSILHTTITVTPPPDLSSDFSYRHIDPPRLLVDLIQGSFFTILPSEDRQRPIGAIPQWYMGNIYAMNHVLPQAVSLPDMPSLTRPTTYELFVSGDYEIRLFGDPLSNGNKDGIPVLSIQLSVEVEPIPKGNTVAIIPQHGVACDFVDGWAFGDALGVGMRSVSGWWTVDGVSLGTRELIDRLNITLLQNITLAPTQTRIVPLKLVQLLPFGGLEIPISLHLTSQENKKEILQTSVTVRQHPHWSPSEIPAAGIQATYFYGTSTPTAFMVTPPEDPNEGRPKPPVLALHGAGVDILTMPFWIQAVPRQRHSWIVAPTGRTAWGLDWHGPSAIDAWGCVDALHDILKRREAWRGYELAENTRVLLLGHSNGGQGAWWNAERYPDRIVGVIPAAGYLKSQLYVSLIQSHSAHYVDPTLRAILETALTADDNDLFLSNLAHTPILAIHGGDDDNVPVWHSRAYVSTLKTWNPNASVALREDPGQLHWYTGLFDNADVREYMRTMLESKPQSAIGQSPNSFTLTVSIPAESGSLHGWRIHQLLIPGRLGRLSVKVNGASVDVRTHNVGAFSVRHALRPGQVNNLVVDGITFPQDGLKLSGDTVVYFSCTDGTWQQGLSTDNLLPAIQPSGRMASILTSPTPLTVVYEPSSRSSLSAALRVAAALYGYHQLDAEIIGDAEAVRRLSNESLGAGNIIVLASGIGRFAELLLTQQRTAFSLEGGSLLLRGKPLSPESAALFLHPHPHVSASSVLFLYVRDDSGLERALRLFPIRTGVPVPDWVVTTASTDEFGAGGIEGAG